MIFHSYVCLPEGNCLPNSTHFNCSFQNVQKNPQFHPGIQRCFLTHPGVHNGVPAPPRTSPRNRQCRKLSGPLFVPINLCFIPHWTSFFFYIFWYLEGLARYNILYIHIYIYISRFWLVEKTEAPRDLELSTRLGMLRQNSTILSVSTRFDTSECWTLWGFKHPKYGSGIPGILAKKNRMRATEWKLLPLLVTCLLVYKPHHEYPLYMPINHSYGLLAPT